MPSRKTGHLFRCGRCLELAVIDYNGEVEHHALTDVLEYGLDSGFMAGFWTLWPLYDHDICSRTFDELVIEGDVDVYWK